MKTAYITAAHPQDVAREVEEQVARGCRSFVLRPVGAGGMADQPLDKERLGAARYAAGLQAEVLLESGVPAAARRFARPRAKASGRYRAPPCPGTTTDATPP